MAQQLVALSTATDFINGLIKVLVRDLAKPAHEHSHLCGFRILSDGRQGGRFVDVERRRLLHQKPGAQLAWIND